MNVGCPDDAVFAPFSEFCYFALTTQQKKWEAENICREKKGRLAEIRESDALQAVFRAMEKKGNASNNHFLIETFI